MSADSFARSGEMLMPERIDPCSLISITIDLAGLPACLLGSDFDIFLSLRIGKPPKALGNSLDAQESRLQNRDLLVDIASGLVYIASSPDSSRQTQVLLDKLRKPALAAGGYAVVLRTPHDWTGKLARWVYPSQTCSS